MDWFYSDAGQQKGPVTSEQLSQLVAQGVIRADTLVWRDGMAAWQPYSQVSDPSLPQAQAAKVICSQCGQMFESDQTFRHGDFDVCGDCTPSDMHRANEGEPKSLPAAKAAKALEAASVLMIIHSSLCLVAALIGLLGFLGVMAGLFMPEVRPGDTVMRVMMTFRGGFGIAWCIFGLVLHSVVIAGALKMQRLQSHKIALAAATITLVTPFCCWSWWCLFGTVLGIGALVQLNKPEIRSAFPDGLSTIMPYKNKPALVAFYCGVFGLIPVFLGPLALFGIVPLVLGIMGLRNARANPGAKGTAHAWVAIVLGGLETLVGIV
ncbi:MAG: DUF4339 domain-containing protein, partial [Gemmatimonadetes bacterium]|nr:DUF4339 domain-containing protein [Gemmatimonadota bacterium]